MAAAKKHRGLGRGLDALIPVVETQEENSGSSEKEEDKEVNRKSKNLQIGAQTVQSTGERKTDEDETSAEYIRMVKLTMVEPDRSQPRKNFDQQKLEELADSIRSKGLLEPIIVQDKGNHYEIIAGERRWRACKLVELKEIPVIVRNYDEMEKIEVSLIENIQREDLNPIEEARAYLRLTEEFHLKQEEVAQKVSKNRASVANSIRLLKLTDEVQQMVIDGTLSMGHARALIPIEEKLQITIAQKIVSENLSVRETEKLIRKMTTEQKENGAEEKKIEPSTEVIYHDIADKMNAALGMKVRIKSQGDNKGKLEISFSDQNDLEKLMDLLMAKE